MINLPYAEDINYWKSGNSTPDVWLDKAEKIINDLGGEVFLRAEGQFESKRAFIIDFAFYSEKFRIIWPVLESK